MALIKCEECGKEISDTSKTCIHCGCPVVRKITCPECKKEVLESEKKCPNCGYALKKGIATKEVKDKVTGKVSKTVKEIKNSKDKKKFYIIGGITALILIIILIISISNNNTAIKVDITMNSWYGEVDTILEDFDLEFYAVTSGANCYSGTKYASFETQKYGILYTEFTYCKSNNIKRLRVYNKSSDQKLREPKAGEIPTYNIYGTRISSSDI